MAADRGASSATILSGIGASASEREKALDSTMTQIERRFGKGAIMRLGEHRAHVHVGSIPTGAIALDLALGIGGVPRGRVTEIYGPESSGKTTLCLHVIANSQRNGGVCAIVDAEHALDPDYAEKLGVKKDELLISQPDTGEQALEIVEMLVRSGAVEVIVVDSVAALVPRAEIEGEMGDSHVGLQARLMSQALRKLTGAINNSGSTVIFTNQIREKVGVMFGSPETTPGGRALKFYASVRMDPPHRVDQDWHRGGRQPHAREGGEEQGRGALPHGGVRHHVQRGHLARGRPDRHRPGDGYRQEVGRVLLDGRYAPGSGPRERQGVPAHAS